MYLTKGRWLAVAVALFFAVPSLAVAQTEAFPNSTIGVIDVQRILVEADVSKKIHEDHDKYLQQYQTDAQNEEKALGQEMQKIISSNPDQKTEAFAKQRQEFDRKVQAFQQKFSTLRRDLDRALAQALNEVYASIAANAEEIAGNRGVNLVLYKNQMLLFDPRMDMTDDVLRRVNETLKTVEFPDPMKMPEIPAK